MKKLRVGVIMGGRSLEREVSLNSGRTVCDHLDRYRYQIIPLFQTIDGTLFRLPWKYVHRGKISDFEHKLLTQESPISWDDLKSLIDFLYIAVHGQYAEDGRLQGILELLQIPYLGSGILASALTMNKATQKDMLRAAGIAVPNGISVTAHELSTNNVSVQNLIEQLTHKSVTFPLVVKPACEGSSIGVSIVHTADELIPALHQALDAINDKQQPILIEEKIIGMEFSCISLYDYKNHCWQALPPTEVVHRPGTEFFDYEQKYMPGKAIEYTPARCNNDDLIKIQQTCIATTRALGMRTISRVDGFLTNDGRVVVVDPNTISGMAPASFVFREAAHINLNHPQLINHLIECELDQRGMLEPITSFEQGAPEMNAKKLRVAVLMGGRSNEKEISLESGRNIVYKLSHHTYDVLPLFVSSALELYHIDQKLLVRSSTHEIEELVTTDMKVNWSSLPSLVDFVFIGLHGGEGENGAVQGMLEMLNLPYNGSGVLTSALCMDKFKTNQLLEMRGFHVPKGMLISREEWLAESASIMARIIQHMPLPTIIKPHDDGCSTFVQKATTHDEIRSSIEALFAHGKHAALVEECIIGMELTVGVLGNLDPIALPPSQAIATKGILSIQEKFLPGAGENQTPAPLAPEILSRVQETIKQAYITLNCRGYSRIDCFYQTAQESPTGEDRVVLLEVNTLPGMTPATCIFHQAAEIGMAPGEFIDRIVTLGLEEHQAHKTELLQKQAPQSVLR